MVSIIIPVYNRAHLVGRTLQSVAAQSLRPLEVVLIDNGSTDGTLAVLQEFKREHECADLRVVVDVEPRRGATKARNRGARLSSGNWLLFFDSDDTMDPDMVECYLAAARRQGGTDLVAGRADRVDLDGSKHEKPYYKTDLLANSIFHASLCPLQCCLISRGLCERAGWWNEVLPTWNDWEFSIRLLLQQPSITFYDEAIKVHIFLQRESITGVDFASKAGSWELAIDAVEQELINAGGVPCRERLLKYVEYRRVVLSGLYLGEGRKDLAALLFGQVCNRLRRNVALRLLYSLLRYYIAAGGRGASHIVKALVR